MKKRWIPKAVADKLITDMRNRCCICRRLIDPLKYKDAFLSDSLEKHHIIHFAHGGGNDYNNLLLVCANCHTRLHSRSDNHDMKELKRLKDHWYDMRIVVPNILRLDDNHHGVDVVIFSIESLNLQHSIHIRSNCRVRELASFIKENILIPLGKFDKNDSWINACIIDLALKASPSKKIPADITIESLSLKQDDIFVSIIHTPIMPMLDPRGNLPYQLRDSIKDALHYQFRRGYICKELADSATDAVVKLIQKHRENIDIDKVARLTHDISHHVLEKHVDYLFHRAFEDITEEIVNILLKELNGGYVGSKQA